MSNVPRNKTNFSQIVLQMYLLFPKFSSVTLKCVFIIFFFDMSLLSMRHDDT